MGYLPEVVRIIAAHMNGPTGGKAIGTGFFLAVDGVNVHEEGLLLTNAHVVTNSPVVKIMTTYIEHQALPVTVVAVCHDRDLALLKVEPQVHQFLKRILFSRYNLDHIPALLFANSDTLRTGAELHAVGHPLGLIDQQFTSGKYQGCVHLNNEIRGLSGALINGGNSGGPLMQSVKYKTQQSVEGLHYFIPSRYKVIGINTFKLTGDNVDGENGFIHSNTVKTVLPTLMRPLQKRYEREKKMMTMLKTMSVQAKNPGAAAAVMDHLSTKECQVLTNSSIEAAWTEHALGGISGGQPRTFSSWMKRHVFAPNTKHMHRGGPELLSKVLTFAKDCDWQGLSEWKGNKQWGSVRTGLTDVSIPETRPAMIRILPPPAAHVHSPHIGIVSQPIYTSDLLVHYDCPKTRDTGWVAKGGILVNDIEPNSLFKLAGGQKDDIVFKFENSQEIAELTPGGTWYSKKRDLPMSLTDLCNDTPIDANIKLHILRKGQGIVHVSFVNREPTYKELADVRNIYAFCDEGRFEQQQKVQVQGIVFAPLRVHHVGMFKLLDYMAPDKRFNFKIVVENVSPESTAYATDAVHPGSIVTHINDEPVAQSWTAFQEQVKYPHKETGCWVLDTEYNGNKSKYAILARKIQTK